jgi:hypothetical protein
MSKTTEIRMSFSGSRAWKPWTAPPITFLLHSYVDISGFKLLVIIHEADQKRRALPNIPRRARRGFDAELSQHFPKLCCASAMKEGKPSE